MPPVKAAAPGQAGGTPAAKAAKAAKAAAKRPLKPLNEKPHSVVQKPMETFAFDKYMCASNWAKSTAQPQRTPGARVKLLTVFSSLILMQVLLDAAQPTVPARLNVLHEDLFVSSSDEEEEEENDLFKAAGAAGGRGSGPGWGLHLVPGAWGEPGEGPPADAGDYGNGLEAEELEPEDLLLEPESKPKPEENAPRPRAPPGVPGFQEEEEEPGLVQGDPGHGAIEDPELEAINARVREMEEVGAKLKELQNEVEKQMNRSPPPGNAGPGIMSIEEKMEADARSIYVGNVDYGATAEELEAHCHGCGSVHRVTILWDKFSGHPKGFAYIEFSDKASVRTSMALDESLFVGRQIKVTPKRTNRPGISTTDRGFPRARYSYARATNYSSSRYGFYSGFNSRPRRRVYRARARATSWYSLY
ncbi:LOW QUALITY PROTEIN: polyadenylate-binding protein 2-like [Dromiciops gliroides]|uniref:LOW QUALITY PROTEIN: polyadenylate-binding protein 2-like n=1 Tax=Dromiciops gliroides TaxID=33562 RepID=UPI001CC69600|nr:LOW QUALITY PROTEIN: polyadenylate-binding protein 2-like [Dromiciops gliroides]